ncbi:hypothetical protein MAPG_08182 [Magnaporthiopsis poae ATCC 64411]|uniref:Uncharacterized protein n=1 Tax=Magnaporthiopsis poae (strain ATCC 64411 / 73-15) TaxID=644358 RepID=A0A0C4E6N8_MAGP6|nr:hypothetical protein MAPG_08182 [Magnaporthiopsis poae ATCC 64411]
MNNWGFSAVALTLPIVHLLLRPTIQYQYFDAYSIVLAAKVAGIVFLVVAAAAVVAVILAFVFPAHSICVQHHSLIRAFCIYTPFLFDASAFQNTMWDHSNTIIMAIAPAGIGLLHGLLALLFVYAEMVPAKNLRGQRSTTLWGQLKCPMAYSLIDLSTLLASLCYVFGGALEWGSLPLLVSLVFNLAVLLSSC